ncbi:hypothetical protein [Achromobacter aloeverae]
MGQIHIARPRRTAIIGIVLALALALLAVMILARRSVTGPSDLSGILTVARDRNVVAYRDMDWCRYLKTGTQLYADPPTSSSGACLANREPYAPFTPASKAIFSELRRAFDAAGISIMEASFTFADDGSVDYADLLEQQLVGHDAYLYDARDVPPYEPKGMVTRIGKGWFHYVGE